MQKERKTIRHAVVGQCVKAQDQPVIWELIKEISGILKVDPPQHLVLGLNAEFFVSEANVICLDGELTGRTIHLSLPFCRILSINELKAILFHEFGHYIGKETRYLTLFNPIYRNIHDFIVQLSMWPRRRWFSPSWIALLPTGYLLNSFINCFSTIERSINRNQELVADALAASMTKANTFGIALVKIHSFASLSLIAALKQKIKVPSEGKKILNSSQYFALLVSKFGGSISFEKISHSKQTGQRRFTASHPPLKERLEFIGTSIAACAEGARVTCPVEPASMLIANYEAIEEYLTKAKTQQALDKK